MAPPAEADLLRPEGSFSHGSVPPGCVLRFFREGDEHRLLELLTDTFPRWPAVAVSVPAIDHLRWKLHSRPDAVRYHVVAELGERIIGCRLFLPQKIKIGDRFFEVRQGVDTVIHKEYQGRGLMVALTYPVPDRLWNDFDMDFSVRSGAKALNDMRRYDERDNRYAWLDVLHLDAAAMAEPADRLSAADWSIATVPRFDERIRPFVKEASAPFWFIVDRTPENLNWRYADALAGAFTIRQAESNGRVIGYSVLRLSGDRGYIADLLALPARHDVVESILFDAHRHFVANGARSVEWWATQSHPYRDIFEQAGYRPKRRRELYCQPFHVEDEVVMPFEDPNTPMHIVSGDTDLV